LSLKQSFKIAQYDKENNLLNEFISLREAFDWILKNNVSKSKNFDTVRRKIRQCIDGEMQTAYGYIWKFI
jgi:hypothetical protein